jgi:hypothetical protein
MNRALSGRALPDMRGAPVDHPVPIAVLKRRHRNDDPSAISVNTLFWKILVTRVQRKIA